MDATAIYNAIIERTMETVLKTPEASRVRRDVVEAVKRKWAAALSKPDGTESSSQALNSEPIDRSKYFPGRTVAEAEVKAEPVVVRDDSEFEDEFADEFGEAEFVHATEVGRKLADAPALPPAAIAAPIRPVKTVSKKEIVGAEELEDSLADAEYDALLEPEDCDIRIFGQTEVCESVEGPRRADSRWMVTVLNGFVQLKPSGEEYLFRTANQMMPHSSQRS